MMFTAAIVGQGEEYKHCLDKDKRFLVLQTIIDEEDDLSLLPGVDLVIIATKLETHAGLVKYYLNQNKDILCAGPLAQTTKEIDEIAASAVDKQKKVMVDFEYIFSSSLVYAKQLISTGGIGKLNYMEFALKRYGGFHGVYWTSVMELLAVYDMFVPLDNCLAQPIKFVNNDLIKVLLNNGDILGFMDVSILSPDEEDKFSFYGETGSVICNLRSDPTVRYYNHMMRGHFVDNYNEYNRKQLCLDYVYQVLTNEAQSNLKRARNVTNSIQGMLNAVKK